MNDAATAAQSDTRTDADRARAQARAKFDERHRILALLRRFWRRTFTEDVDRLAAISRIVEECRFGGRYVFMTSMSAGIAVLGLILSSPAVVIGAMLLSPLMGPIIGAGFALAIWDTNWLRSTARTLFIGTVAAILLSALITWLSPIQTVTPEIASRTRPSLLDLGVAFFSALAGSYAMIRGRAGAIVGVAIAVALMPPLSVVGFGLATFNWTVFSGALLLYVTNLITIAAAAAGMARLYGFRSSLSKSQGWLQSAGILVALGVLAVPLTISLSDIAWEARATRAINDAIVAEFDPRARLDTVDINWNAKPLAVTAVMLTPDLRADAESRVARTLEDQLGRPVALEIEQFQVAVGSEAAEQAALAAARNREAAETTQRQIDTLTDRLALVAGVEPAAVTIDRDKRRAIVRARPIAGAELAAYRIFERRVAQTAPGWQVELVPPLRPLPAIPLDAEGRADPEALATVLWAARRRDQPIALSGPADLIDRIASSDRAQGVTIERTASEESQALQADWLLPAVPQGTATSSPPVP